MIALFCYSCTIKQLNEKAFLLFSPLLRVIDHLKQYRSNRKDVQISYYTGDLRHVVRISDVIGPRRRRGRPHPGVLRPGRQQRDAGTAARAG